MFRGYFKEISRVIQGCFKHVSREFQVQVLIAFQGCFKKVSLMFQECLNGVTKQFKASFKEISRVYNIFFQKRLQKALEEKIQLCFKRFSMGIKEISMAF